MDIDWTRVAEPQLDQYDTQVILGLLSRGRRVESPRRSSGAPTVFDGSVEIRPIEGPYLQMDRLSAAPADDERILVAEGYVRRWPAAFQQFRALMHTFYPVRDITGTRILPGGKGSMSHSFADRIGTMCATIEDPVSLSQAFVHEMAHNKLRALGIMVESTQGFITNDPQVLYPSPVLIGTPRPMTAVFHAEYSFIYVTQLDLMILATDPDKELRDYVLVLLKRNVTRMEAGLGLIQDQIQVDSIGRPFVEGFISWAQRVLSEGREIFEKRRIEQVA
jgi:HEXXH motif-containing protein